MLNKVCYIDPLTFITKKLYDVDVEKSAYFFDIDDENQQTSLNGIHDTCKDTIGYGEIIAYGEYSGNLYWCINMVPFKDEKIFTVLFSYANIVTLELTQGLFHFKESDNITESGDTKSIYGRLLVVGDVNTESSNVKDIYIYFDSISDLVGILKNETAQSLINKR